MSEPQTFRVIREGHIYGNPSIGEVIHFERRDENGDYHPGFTNEVLLEILLDRLTHLQTRFPCEENRVAMSGITQALDALYARTMRRIEQGIEGTHSEAPMAPFPPSPAITLQHKWGMGHAVEEEHEFHIPTTAEGPHDL